VKNKIISGIMVTMFLVTMVAFAVPVRVSADPGADVVIGLIGPMGWIQWDGIREGAYLARDLINNAPDNDKGMWDGNQYHLVKFVEIDEHSVPVPDPTAAAAELLATLDAHKDIQLLVGGFLGESLFPLRDVAMDYAAEHGRPIWTICGASDLKLIDCAGGTFDPVTKQRRPFCGACVRCDYERYKYMFRSDPMNATYLSSQLMGMAGQLAIPKLKAIFEEDPLPTYLIAEDLLWADIIVDQLHAAVDLLGIDLVGESRPSSIETDFSPYLDAIEVSGARVIIHLFAAVAGATFIKQWGERKLAAVPVGINVESMAQDFYETVGGLCEYETIMAATGTRTNTNPDAKPLSTTGFWDKYLEKYGHAPIYTAWGSYLELMLLNDTAADWIGESCDTIIPLLEGIVRPNTFLGCFKYTKYHDLYSDQYALLAVWPSHDMLGYDPEVPGTVRAHIPQWQAGRMEVVWPRGRWRVTTNPEPLIFARKWKVPPSVYSLGETDFAGPEILPHPTAEIVEAMGLDPSLVGYFGNFMLPDGTVGSHDMGAVTQYWQDTTPWTLLEADMDGNNFIDIDDVARVALDWGKSA